MSLSRGVKISRFLSMVLRHKPETVGLSLDAEGWVEVPVLLDALQRYGNGISLEELQRMVATNDKQRFAFSADGKRIRASQGHSLSVDLALEPVAPPEFLFHGTADRFLDAIRREGLKKMSRQHVHLSADEATAAKVGVRHGRLVMLRVRAAQMHAAGMAFYLSANGVWLTDAVPAAFLEIPGDAQA